jgi:hypothetical protein
VSAHSRTPWTLRIEYATNSPAVDAFRRRVLPEVSGRQIDLFKRLGL